MGTITEENPDQIPLDAEKEAIKPMKFYLFTLEGSNKIIQTKWGQTCLIVAVLYIYHLIWTMCGVNMFSS